MNNPKEKAPEHGEEAVDETADINANDDEENVGEQAAQVADKPKYQCKYCKSSYKQASGLSKHLTKCVGKKLLNNKKYSFMDNMEKKSGHVEERMENIDNKMSRIDTKTDQNCCKMKKIEEKLENGVEIILDVEGSVFKLVKYTRELGGRMSKSDSKFDTQAVIVGKLLKRSSELDEKIRQNNEQVSNKIDKLQDTINKMFKQTDELRTKIDKIEKQQTDELRTKIDKIEKQMTTISEEQLKEKQLTDVLGRLREPLMSEISNTRDEMVKNIEFIKKNMLSNNATQLNNMAPHSRIMNNSTGDISIKNTVTNINIVKFGDENLEKLIPTCKQYFEQETDFLIKIIEHVHCNPDLPEYRNCYVKNRTDVNGMIHNGSDWSARPLIEIINTLKSIKSLFIENTLGPYIKQKINKQQYQSVVDYLKRINDDDVKKEHINSIIELLMKNDPKHVKQ